MRSPKIPLPAIWSAYLPSSNSNRRHPPFAPVGIAGAAMSTVATSSANFLLHSPHEAEAVPQRETA